ncbi:DUF445 domain-containing protein [Corynebacterium gottingense]|uniref:DUF445 family protein n=1 Tax=Corynebacterium gottingense TaxID=2041036 RepID=A0ABX9UM54_9CORY|nr:DUF445 family protein [Corynebacterium gottingense]RMD20560.1 DUF445 family protein [Corynebacterium gottingense]WJZ12205.1 hypothetical protein CGOTT_01195 [Corynebacterium gottingense]WJZ14523.1 hypothetical protein CGOTTB_01180 [Corynebacterium gottingense]
MSQHAMMPAPSNEVERRRILRNHKIFVTSLLGLMAVIFLSCSWWQSHGAPAWVGYVRAAAEAGMVGGLADWFAVTALFRYPMGLPIPHTAIIPNKKDQVADALSEFVSENFLNARTITQKVMEANLPQRVGTWLTRPASAERVSQEVGDFTVRVVRGIDPADAEAFINTQLIDRLAEPTWGPPVGRALEGFIADGKAEPIVEDILAWSRAKLDGMEQSIVTLIDDRMPRWAPKFAKDLVGEKVYTELVKFMAEVDRDPNHEARRAIRRQLSQFAQDLQFDSQMITRVEALKGDVMGSTAVTSAASSMWEQLADTIVANATDPQSMLRRKVADAAAEWGGKLANDPEVRASAEQKLEKVVHFAAENGADQIVGIIAETIQRWDGAEASDKIELMVGKDLQFIRLNGTIVGALAGLVIYTVSQLLFY